MEPMEENGRVSSAVVWVSLGGAAVFEALTVLATQDKTVRAVSPWQDDPYDVMVSLAQFTVPMLALVIALRLLAWRAPGGADRARQTMRAAGAMTTLVGLTLAFECVAVIARTPSSFSGWASVLISGLAVNSVLTVVAAAWLVRCRRRPGSSRSRRHDWLGDAVFVCRRIPVLRRWADADAVGWVRRRAMTVFAVLSTLAAAGITAAQAIGEHWTDPLLIAWMLIVVATSNLAFCVISNAVAGFIARLPRTRTRRIAEASTVAGCVAISVATAFRDALWPVFGTGPLASVPALAALTLGAGLAASVITAAVLLACFPQGPSGSRRHQAGAAGIHFRRPGANR
ncbi:hypothetical protein AB0L75_24630 [Streptomyces sp. NPDC052101]|uniref:hypothetical protein n=1 Tax=Streptomyces sp. NPDC052101 TaxID=3155763 RepID=UPI003433254B